jgi:hypothetical protein
MNAFRLAIISENSRLCYQAMLPGGCMEIVDMYRKRFNRMPHCTWEAIADIARDNVTLHDCLDNSEILAEVNARRGYDN